MSHVISARCVSRDLNRIAPWSLILSERGGDSSRRSEEIVFYFDYHHRPLSRWTTTRLPNRCMDNGLASLLFINRQTASVGKSAWGTVGVGEGGWRGLEGGGGRMRRASHTSVLNLVLVATALSHDWRYGVSARTGWLGVSMLWLGQAASLKLNFCLSVAIRATV